MSFPKQRTPATPDERIDEVLAELGRAQPPCSLEQRTLQRLAHRQAAAPHTRWSDVTAGALPLRLVALASAVLLIAGVLLTRASHRVATPPLQAHTPANPRPFLPEPSEPISHSTQQRVSASVSLHASPSLRHSLLPVAVISTGTPRRSAASVAPPDKALDNDGPAPELPLTEQERLLLRIGYGLRPQQLASLQHFKIRIRPDDEGPDFQTFFEPHTTPLIEGDPQ